MGQFYALAALPRGKKLGYHGEEGECALEPFWTLWRGQKPVPLPRIKSRSFIPNPATLLTELPRPYVVNKYWIKFGWEPSREQITRWT